MKIVPQSVQLEGVTKYVGPRKLDLAHGTDGALLIEDAGRTCWKSEGKAGPGTARKFVRFINSKNHKSVIEHPSATFRIICDRGVTHEIVRHRIASYSQESTRYCNYGQDKFGKEITVIEPPGLEGRARQLWVRAMRIIEWIYMALLALGVAPQIARSVLPTCLKTEIVVTMNFREWAHFLYLRAAPAAHPQIREIAFMIWEELKVICPEVFQELTIEGDTLTLSKDEHKILKTVLHELIANPDGHRGMPLEQMLMYEAKELKLPDGRLRELIAKLT